MDDAFGLFDAGSRLASMGSFRSPETTASIFSVTVGGIPKQNTEGKSREVEDISYKPFWKSWDFEILD